MHAGERGTTGGGHLCAGAGGGGGLCVVGGVVGGVPQERLVDGGELQTSVPVGQGRVEMMGQLQDLGRRIFPVLIKNCVCALTGGAQWVGRPPGKGCSLVPDRARDWLAGLVPS